MKASGRPTEDLLEQGKRSLLERARSGRVHSTNGFVAGATYLLCSAGLALSALSSGLDDWREGPELALCSLVTLLLGLAHVAFFRLPTRLRTPTAFAAVASIFTVFVVSSTFTYLVTGTFDRFDDALFESVSGVTTTALSVLEQPEATARGVVFWRAATQWIGGFLSLLVVVALLPFLGVGGVEVSDVERSPNRLGFFSPKVKATMWRLGTTYLALSAAGAALFFMGGMGPFDAVTYAFTTISTGGFENHTGSFAFFDSVLIEWLAIGGMALAGANIALLAGTLRGSLGPLQRSAEVRVYGAILVFGSLATYWLARPGIGSGMTQFREVAFSVTSVVSTTGASVTDWGGWPVGPQVLLLLMMGVGAMSGSTGGGFRIVRAMALVGYVRRELVRQLHPRSVVVVKVGRVGLDEGLVSRLVGYQVLFVVVAGFGAIGIAAFDVDLLTAISASISAMSNVGPALGDLTPASGASALSAGARMMLLPIMILGRLEISPVLIGIGNLLRVQRRIPRAVRRAARNRS